MTRYDHLGAVYDLVSLEAVLYRRPRARLAELFGAMPGATVADVGCGTGLNLAWLRAAVSPGGRVVGIDASASMLAAARRRTQRHGWAEVTLAQGDVSHLDVTLDAAAVVPDAFVATFVLSLLADAAGFWAAVDEAAAVRRTRVAIAELGAPGTAHRALRPALAALTALGGGRPDSEPWRHLEHRAPDLLHETHLGGHVHLAIGTCGVDLARRDDVGVRMSTPTRGRTSGSPGG